MTTDSTEPVQAALQRMSELLQAGQPPAAAAALRQAFDQAPADPAVKAAVKRFAAQAHAWLGLGQIDQARALLAPLAGSGHAHDELLMLYGHALMALGQKDEAEGVLRRWAAMDPDSHDAALRLAAVLADNGKPAEAESLVRTEVARHGEAVDAAFVLGRALLGQSRFEEAETQFRKVVQRRPDHPVAHSNLMELVWMRTGDVHAASRAIDRALRAQPQLHGLRINKARLLMSARMPREALAALDAGLVEAEADAALLDSAVTIALDFDSGRAMDYARRLLQAAPDKRSAHIAFGNASLATGQAQVALDEADALHQSDPNDGQALAMQADALRMLGDSRCRELLDYPRRVRAEFITVPDGWGDLEGYLADLVDALQRLHSLRAHPIGNSLREGSQVELRPAQSPNAAIRAFPQAIDGPIRHYMQALGTGSDAMRRRNTGAYRISGMWSVRLRPNGFHVNHYHPQGWISSACYLHLPSAVARQGEGWLKFGEPAFPTRPALDPEYFIKPEPGLLALFPSYMWHGTVPFSGDPDATRLTIAFDVVPIPA